MTGRDGGHTVSLQSFHAQGVQLVGRVADIDGATVRLHADLHDNMRAADRFAAGFHADVDTFIRQQGLDAPPAEPEPAHAPVSDFTAFPQPAQLDLTAAGITSVIWATGFRFDYTWVAATVFDKFGYPITTRGETKAPGLYFLGLNYLQNRKSGIIYGVGDDADYVAGRIRAYLDAPRS